MADSGIFRVQINLGNFFSDHKAKAYVSVDTQWKNVRQFHRHIGEIFDIKRFLLLTNDGVYLPGKCLMDTFLLKASIIWWFFYCSQRKYRHHSFRWCNSVSILLRYSNCLWDKHVPQFLFCFIHTGSYRKVMTMNQLFLLCLRQWLHLSNNP